jgi:hypothetical protein
VSVSGEARASLKTTGETTVRLGSTSAGPTQRTTGEASVKLATRGEAKVAGVKY